jgi:hypothetical protein
MLVPCECLLAYWLLFLLPAIESNNTESTGEGEVFGYPGEDQGQAEKGKTSKLEFISDPSFTYCMLYKCL